MSYKVTPNYITDSEAEEVLAYLNSIFIPSTFNTRSVERFGKYRSISPIKNKIIPPVLQFLCDKLQADGLASDIHHVTVNRYDPGQIIPWHIDNKWYGKVVTIISLGSEATLVFRNNKEIIEVVIPPNSLTQFKDDIRWKYEHSIKPVPGLRYSLVFRNN